MDVLALVAAGKIDVSCEHIAWVDAFASVQV